MQLEPPRSFCVVMTRCVLRPALAEEAPILSQLAFASKASWGYSEAFMANCRDELTYTAEQIRSSTFEFVVTVSEDGKITGFYALERISATVMEVEALFVAPAFLGRGHGRALMEHAKARARNQGVTSLVIQGDPNAARFYAAAGGVETGTRPSASIPGRTLPIFVIAL